MPKNKGKVSFDTSTTYTHTFARTHPSGKVADYVYDVHDETDKKANVRANVFFAWRNQ